jgi:hypothetical protein
LPPAALQPQGLLPLHEGIQRLQEPQVGYRLALLGALDYVSMFVLVCGVGVWGPMRSHVDAMYEHT